MTAGDFIQRGGSIRVQDVSSNDKIILDSSSGTISEGGSLLTEKYAQTGTTNTFDLDQTFSSDVIVDGSMGIGTTNPSAKLEVNGNAVVSGTIKEDGELLTEKYAQLNDVENTFTENQIIQKNTPTISLQSTNSENGITIRADVGDSTNFGLVIKDKTLDEDVLKLRNGKMAIGVGVGTIIPSETLDVSGNAVVSGTISEDGELLTEKYAQLKTTNTFTQQQTFNSSIQLKSASIYNTASTIRLFPYSDVNTNQWFQFQRIDTGPNAQILDIQINDGYNEISTRNNPLALQPYSGYNVGIGTTNPSETLEVEGGSIKISSRTTSNPADGATLRLNGDYYSQVVFDEEDNENTFFIRYNGVSSGDGNYVAFGSGYAPWVQEGDGLNYIPQNGRVGIGTTNPSEKLEVDGGVKLGDGAGSLTITAGGSYALYDPTSGVNYFKGDVGIGTGNPGAKLAVSGNIKATSSIVENTTITFTGQHRSYPGNSIQFTQVNKLIGLIVYSNGEYMSLNTDTPIRGKNGITISESIPMIDLTVTANDKKSFGVIANAEDPEVREDKYGLFTSIVSKSIKDRRIFINSLGEGAIWVSDINGSLENGDYITSSVIPGYGQCQDDDLLHNYTVAKITMDCDFSQPQKAKLIPKKEIIETQVEREVKDESGNVVYEDVAVLDESGNEIVDESGNVVYERKAEMETITETTEEEVLDENGKLVWIEELDASGNVVMEPAYEMRYLQIDGVEITKEEYETRRASGDMMVYRAAFVGCTYHCG